MRPDVHGAMKIVTVVGARPQFIKCAPVSRLLRQSAREILVHTGQHYDANMSASFFEQLGIPDPDRNLGAGSGSHGAQTGEMLRGIERILLDEKPDAVLVYGDTNSTLAGALAASKLLIPVAHVEAGLRSFNKSMPEEQNRIVTDHLSTLLFCPTQTAIDNLTREGITAGVHLSGDVMYDALIVNAEIASRTSSILHELNLAPNEYLMATVHRAESTDNPEVLGRLVDAFNQLCERGERIVFPVHPRTRPRLAAFTLHERVAIVDPVAYLDMLQLERNARMILTDSGGVQKEAFWLSTPCVTLRNETEWVETVRAGWNVLAGSDIEAIVAAVEKMNARAGETADVPEDGKASERIVERVLALR
jgi:UDP-N-acetylglucosamine 2-epimerase